MEFSTGHKDHQAEIVAFFASVFSASEGPGEGALIGEFVTDLLATTPAEDVLVCTAHDEHALVGCLCWSRMRFAEDTRMVFILSPVAVHSERQREGIGQRLIGFGLDQMRLQKVDVVLTYGDPAYYGKSGFLPITSEVAQPPLPLSYPHGWLGQSLTDEALAPLQGQSRCVAALNNPNLW
ncbi:MULTISPECIES: GNAT family N-acetyltransferase [unclassified Ruegeria]|uniref:GNAT family N-acetyltransferase n=1 Tax=unclassified Ruegeria TaxID=2625375 RepID=UPI0014883E19|nr:MULTISPECIES: N-acetyltransferase [unclassified Ruegeria]